MLRGDHDRIASLEQRLAGSPARPVHALEDLGVTRYTIGPLKNPLPKEEFAEWIQRFGEDLISKCP